MIQIYKDQAGEWRFRIKGRNGEIVAQGEGYMRKAGALRGVETLRQLLSGPPEIEFNEMSYSDAPPVHIDGMLYSYKDRTYRIFSVRTDHRIQFEGQWRPAVEYTLATPLSEVERELHFFRADLEFAAKFVKVT